MLSVNYNHLQSIIAPVRKTYAKVELYKGSTLVNTFRYDGALKSFNIERVGDESKFFGYGVCQKAKINLIDIERELDITTEYSFNISLNCLEDAEEAYIYPYPTFYITEVNRDENTNELSITAYDGIYSSSKKTYGELVMEYPFTVEELVAACSSALNLSGTKIQGIGSTETCFFTSYNEDANFDGTETIREVLNAIAETTQTIYYLNGSNKLCFKRLDKDGEATLTIDKSRYFTLKDKENRKLTTIAHATELGDNLSSTTGAIGTTQYIRNNPLWDLRTDVATLLDNAVAAVGGFILAQFDCDWRGDYRLEVGDKVALVSKDDSYISSYIINDVVSYDGAFREKTKFNYSNDDSETFTNPTSLGDVIKQTYAKVDKLNKEIELVASETDANGKRISSIELNTNSINAAVEEVKKNIDSSIDGINDNIEILTERVEATMTSEAVKIEIQKQMENGVNKVTTSTGFTFDEDGLLVSKSGSEMTTQITEDGMKVFRNDTEVLTANNQGVNAINLHANTYLIIGLNSRFEDYEEDGEQRTGCFKIGG